MKDYLTTEEIAHQLGMKVGSSFLPLIEALADGFVVLDQAGCCLYLNHVACRMFDRCRTELVEQSLWQGLPELVASPLDFAFQEATRSGQPVSCEFCIAQTGRWFHARLNPTLSGVSIYFTDLAEQMQASLLERERRFRTTFEQAAVGMAHVAPDGRFLAINQRFCELVGYSREEMLARTFQDITFPEDLEADLAYVQQLLAGKRDTYSMEKRYLRRDGSLLWINLTVALVRNEGGIPQYFISVIEDINERKRLEAALARERHVLQTITDNAPDIIARFDRSLRHCYVNPAMTQVTGQPAEAFLGKTNEELGLPEELVAHWNAVFGDVLSTGEPASLEFALPSQRGLRWYHSRVVAERDTLGEIVSLLSCTRDVTELKQTQQALLQSEARARRLIDSNIIGVVIADMEGIFEANDAFLDLVGATREQLETRQIDWQAMTPPEYLPRDFAGLQELRERGSCTPFEKEYVRSDGSRVAVLLGSAVLQMEPLQWMCFVLDITERKRQEQRLQQALGAMLTVAEVLVTREPSTDPQEWSVPSYEEMARRVLVPICQVLSCEGAVMTRLHPGSDLIDLIVMVGFDLSMEQTVVERVREQSITARFANEVLIEQLRRGDVVTLDVNQPPYAQRQLRPHLHTSVLVPIRLGEELVGLLALYPQSGRASYTSEEQVLAAAMAKLAALLIERERLASEWEQAEMRTRTAQEVMRQMDEFLGVVSHELKTPLTSLQTYLQLARRQLTHLQSSQGYEVEAHSQLASLLGRAERQIKRQKRVIDDLLDVSRIEAERLELSPELVNLTQLVQGLVEDQHHLAPTRTISLQVSSVDALVVADADRVGQVVNNYLANALKYSEASRPVEIRVSSSDTMARVEVNDQGPGLAPDQQERIWQRFYRVPGIRVKSGLGVGLGLGLHICKYLIERQAGQVGVQSAPGHGSTFWFTLPLAEIPLNREEIPLNRE